MQSKSRSEWQEIVAEWRRSGLSQKAFCEPRGINPWTFSYWKARMETTPPAAPEFVELRSDRTPAAPSPAVELRITDRLELHLSISPLAFARALGIDVPGR